MPIWVTGYGTAAGDASASDGEAEGETAAGLVLGLAEPLGRGVRAVAVGPVSGGVGLAGPRLSDGVTEGLGMGLGDVGPGALAVSAGLG
ncbi:MAG TPA: hypothetical protein VN771_01470, partial [Candidatus Baltobacteraceae bacterium]|nr:hypothetical protein [Candidatus Baltobacteraceae bacterium]